MRLRALIISGLACGIVGLVYLAGRRSFSPAQTLSSPTDAVPAHPSSFTRINDEDTSIIADIVSPQPSDSASASNVFQRIASGETDLRLSAEEMVAYFQRYGTNVETLLATQNRDYLRLAAELFPNDPRVQYAVITRNLFPEATRDWLERFKQSAPDNPVANYLSAREYLRNGERARGLDELIAAAGKPRFDDYLLEQWQNSEDALLSSGRSIAEGKMAAGISLHLPQLALFKNLAQEMQAMQKQYLSGGDTASAEMIAQVGHTLAQQLMHGDGSRPLINQLVGVAIDRIVLSPLPQDGQPDFLNGTIQQRIEELTAFRSGVRTLMPQFDSMLARGNEAEIIGFFDRLKLEGEYKAMLWLKNRNAPR